MHFLTIVMAQKKEHVPLLLEPYDENDSHGYEYSDCSCLYHSPDKKTPDPACPACEGTGKVLEPCCGPDAHWDWYEDEQSRGRWADYVVPMKPDDVSPENGIPFAIVTPDRGWLDCDFPKDEEDEERWATTYWEAFDEAIANGYKPFVVDCHD